MKFLSFLTSVLIIALMACNSDTQSGFAIEGNLQGIEDTQVFLEKSTFNTPFESVAKAELKDNGDFKIAMDAHPGPGIYRIRSGGQGAMIILGDDEKKVVITATPGSFQGQRFEVTGSASAQQFNQLIRDQNDRKLDQNAMESRLNSAANPFVAQAFASMYLSSRPDFAPIHQKIASRLAEVYPDIKQDDYQTFIAQLNAQLESQRRAERIKVGQPAPDISLPGVDGKERSLSDLRGKVVLVDFWASWCGPCRKANPHVVEMYDKYKARGFDVFSVSLDGLDSKTKNRLGAANIEQHMANARQRWLDAIKADNLKWDNHVSDLRKWESPSAGDYGVTSIPRTFLIDREGKIAAINPRFNLEETILQTL